jgi:hypothetical protein
VTKALCSLIPLVLYGAWSVGDELFCQATPTPTPVPFDVSAFVEMLFKALGPLAILGWYMYQEKRFAEPRREQATREEREKIASISEARITGLVDMAKEMAQKHAEALKHEADAFAASVTRMADVHEKMIENCFHRQAGECEPK